MNEPFDVEISRALKEGAAKSLEGWEFTPAMRSKVMDRIRSEAGTAAPESPPARRFDLNRVVRPLAWVAVAAAAMVIVVNTDLSRLGGFGSAKKTSEMKAEKAAAPAAAPAPAADNQVAKSLQAPAPSAPADAEKAATEPKAMATGTGATPPAVDTTVVAQSRQVAIELTAPAATEARAMTDAPVTLAAPVSSPRMGVAAVATSNIGGAVPVGGEALTLSSLGVKKVDLNNATVWERPLADLSGLSIIAAAPDGRTAVANGGNILYLLDHRGELARTIYGTGTISQLVWSNDGRIASVEGTMVFVYSADSGQPLFYVSAGADGRAAFSPDGTLAVYAQRTTDTKLLALVDAKGKILAEAQPAVAGAGLAVMAEGQVVVAGGQAYDRAGKALWQLPLSKTEGLAALGSDRLVAWDAHNVLTVDARTGSPSGWKAEWKGTPAISRVVTSPDGRFVVITAQAEDGALLWVVNREGHVLLTEKLPKMPVEVGFAGSQIVLIGEGAVEYRLIPQ